MQAEVISTVHQLVVACKRYQSITFTDKVNNITNDDNDPEDSNSQDDYNVEISGVNNISGNNKNLNN